MSSLGALYYTLGLKDLTDADFQRINAKLEKSGCTIKLTPELLKSVTDILPKWVNIDINPNQIEQTKLDNAIAGKVMHAEILPLADKLKSAVVDALKDLPVPLNGLTIPPDKITAAVSNALTSANFSSVGEKAGEELAKSIKVKVEGQTYTPVISANVTKLTDTVNKALDTIFKKEQKVKLDRADIKAFRDELRNKITEGIKVTPTLNVTQEALQRAVEGKVMRVEILPLVTNLRTTIKNAFSQSPAEIEVGPNQTKLRNLINTVLQKQGYMINISTVTGLEKSITTQLNGRVYNVKIRANATEIANSVQASLMQVQSRNFGLQVSKDILRQSIDTALMGKPFNIQIAVMHDQARRAVQNALNNARMVGKDDALAYQRMQTGELRAAQAELARLKAAHQGAASAANTHASASINLGGALGSNIKIAGELGAAMASLYSVHAAKQFLSQVIEIGGELEHQKIALETIYGSESKMESLYGQIKGLARQSPFGVMELTKNIKQLSAYGVAYNEVYDTAKRLADISAATSVDIQRLILAYGKTKNRTFLDGLEAKQFAYANIPIYDMLSKKLTELEGKFVSVKDVMGRIKKREIGFDMVKDILWDMTDEGGKFYNMQEKLAGSVKTSWKLVRDNIELMFGEIAESGAGDGLKSLAEILQGLTKQWKTMASVIGAGAIAFGVYKTAVLAHNVVAGQSITLAAKQHASLKMARHHANLAAQSYRALTQAEEENYLASAGLAKIKGINVLWSKKLTAAEADALLAKKLLTKEDILRLVALRKLTAADAQYVLTTKGMTAADIAEMNAQIARAAAAKRSTVIWMQLKASMAGAVSSLWAFTKATLPLAAISAMAMLWQRNNDEMQKAKDIRDGIFSKATDSAKELKDMLADLKPAEGMSGLELSQAIEQMEGKIKDLSPTPIEDINNSLVAQDGHVRTLTERFDFLKGRLEEVAKAYNVAITSNYDSQIQGALRATDGGNWFTKLFNDDIITNAKDYSNALKRREDAIAKLISQNKNVMFSGINAAMNSDKAFREAVKGIDSYEERLRYLIDNFDKFSAAVLAFDADSARFDGVKKLDKIGNIGQINDAYDELLADTDKFIADLNARLDLNPLTMTEEQKLSLTASLKYILDSMENAGDDAKAVIAQKWEYAWGVVLMEDKIGPALNAKFKNLMENSSEEGMEAIKKKLVYEGLDKLDKEGQKKVRDIMENAKGQVMDALSLTNQEMSDYLASHPLEQIIQLTYTTAKDSPSELAKELVTKHGFPALTNSTDRLVRQWTKSGKMYESRNAAKESLQAVYSELEAAKKEGGEVQRRAQEAYNEVWAALQYLGWTDLETKDQKSNKHSGSKSQKDEVAENLKQRFKDIKDAWGELQKWSKTEGREAAAERIGESGLFSTLPKDKIPMTVEEYRALVAGLEDELRKAGIKGHTQRESLLNDLLKQLLDIDKTVVDEQLKLALDKVSKEAERQLADWNLFDKIRKATGNQELAMSIAFGLNADAETDYPKLIEQQLDKQAKAYEDALAKKTKGKKNEYSAKGYTYASLQNLYDKANAPEANDEDIQAWMGVPEEIRKAWEKANSDIQKYRDKEREEVADLVAQYRNTQEEIIALTAEAEEKKRKIRENKDLSPVAKQQLTDRIDADLNYKVFQKSGEYLNFFNAILSMTGREAEDVGKKIKEALDKKLQAGNISAKEYCEEMEKIDKQLEKIREKQKGFGGFGSFARGGLDQMFKDKYEQAQSDYNKATQNFDTAKQQFDLFSKEGNEAGMQQAQSAMDAASAMQKGASSAMTGAQGAMSTMAVIDTIVHGINDTVQGIKGSFDLIADMADSLGIDTSADTDWGKAGAFLDAFSQASQHATDAWDSLKSGNVGGVIKGVIGSITSWFTTFNRWHDAKLQKQIERSQQVVDNIQRAYDKIERRMANFLGNGRGVEIFNTETLKADLDDVNNKISELESKKAKLEGRQLDGLKAASGIIGGLGILAGPLGAVTGGILGGITGGIMSLVNNSKLRKTNKELNKLYEERERIVARIQAYEDGGAYALQRQMMKEQLVELEKQRQAELDKKKSDDSVVADYEDQIDELKVQIRDFAIEVAKDLYGIDLNGYAEQISDALVNAFATGEDAAKAFDKTVGDIMRDVSSKMISQDILAPMFGDLRDYLFGTDGKGGAFGADFKLSPDEIGAMKAYLDKIKNEGIPAAQELFDAINEATGGVLNDTEKSKSGIVANAQSLTEDTGSLIASYVNAIRASTSMLEQYGISTNEYLRTAIETTLPQMSAISESQLRMQEQIAANTLRNAIAAELIAKSTDNIERLLNRATQGVAKFYIH